MRTFIVGSVVLVLTLGCNRGTGTGGPTGNLPEWKPEEALVGQLTVETPLPGGAFQLKCPPAYQKKQQPAAAGAQLVTWEGVRRPDGSAPMFQIMVMTPPGMQKPTPLESVLGEFLEGVQNRRTNWTRTPTEHGQVNGRPFVRARWTGAETTSGRKMQGFMYVTNDGLTYYQFASQDFEPHHEEALKLTEAVVQTFSKK